MLLAQASLTMSGMRPGRRDLEALGVFTVGLGGGTGILHVGGIAHRHGRVSCAPPPGSVISLCPVRGASVGDAGDTASPAVGWKLTSETLVVPGMVEAVAFTASPVAVLP